MSARIHTCCVCGKAEAWSDSWSWFGSILDLDDGKPIEKVCSDACKRKHGKKPGRGPKTATGRKRAGAHDDGEL